MTAKYLQSRQTDGKQKKHDHRTHKHTHTHTHRFTQVVGKGILPPSVCFDQVYQCFVSDLTAIQDNHFQSQPSACQP